MEEVFLFFFNSAALGAGLAMDAFSVSLDNGLHEPAMPKKRMCAVAGVYAFFQFAMPLIGWICVHTILELFSFLEGLVPWIALSLLLFIGGKMLLEGFREKGGQKNTARTTPLSFQELILQGVATSIDALSVGFTIAEYDPAMAAGASAVIAGVTFLICYGGLKIGKKAGTMLSGRASVLGGCILIAIGIEIFIRHAL